MTAQHIWHSNITSSQLLALPKELLLEIVSYVALQSSHSFDLFPTSLLELSQCCKYLHYLVHKDPWRQQALWPRAFHSRFDTGAIYRRRLHYKMNWQATLKRRCRALSQCRSFVSNRTTQIAALKAIDWEAIWDILTEHDQCNIPHLFCYQVHFAAGIAFQLGPYCDREIYPVVLPILSLLVNYDFTLARFLTSTDAIVSQELSQFAYNFDADALITQHTPLRYFNSLSSSADQQQIREQIQQQQHQLNTFYPAQDSLASAFHLFFATIFANHPNIYQAVPGCIPIPVYTLNSKMFDVEFLRRYERNLFIDSLCKDRSLRNIYADSGFASPNYFVSEAHLIEGEWIGYYTFQDLDENDNWFDGPMRITIKIVPLEDTSGEPINQSSWLSQQFPTMHLKACPLTRFEGTGVDNLGTFTITGLIDDTEEGQVTWEKNYIDSGETWEYSGRFAWPMGLCGRWGDEEYGGPWWMWKASH
ncbi:hypothetical protein BDF20DRAFT_827626 [Mycotypha africana]|uniref:uncharacterized protein n=1 Tax=Mycotypha africana TaxID=64632 RepID=UPI00230149CB|nr:uncharacterized protein BDF20DRAFT_827626 [Mycotypha africana]KAI8968588.1 hypothetical protein BDF20DRAFT_827626 [Mycotypha africana]